MTATAPLFDLDRLPAKIENTFDVRLFFLTLHRLGIRWDDNPDGIVGVGDLFMPLEDADIPFTPAARAHAVALMHTALKVAGDEIVDIAINVDPDFIEDVLGARARMDWERATFPEYLASLRTPETPVTDPLDLEFARALAVLFEQEGCSPPILAGLRDGTLRLRAACRAVLRDPHRTGLAEHLAYTIEECEREGW